MSCRTIDLQCLAIIGFKVILGCKYWSFSVIFFLTFIRATFLGIFQALFRALFTRSSGYFLARKSSLSSSNLLSLVCGLVHVWTILNPREKGIAKVVGDNLKEVGIGSYLFLFSRGLLLFFLLLCSGRYLKMGLMGCINYR